MSAKKTAKKVTIWASLVIAVLSIFGVPVSPAVVSVIEVVQETIEQFENVDTSKVVEDVESETEIK